MNQPDKFVRKIVPQWGHKLLSSSGLCLCTYTSNIRLQMGWGAFWGVDP